MRKILPFALLLALASVSRGAGAASYSSGSMSYHVRSRGTVQAVATSRIVIDGRTFAFAPRMKVFKYVPGRDDSRSGLLRPAEIAEIAVGDVVDFRQEGTMITELYLKRW